MLLYQMLEFSIHGKKQLYKNNNNIQDYFVYVVKKHGKKTVNSSIKIYTSKIENRITFKIKTGYYLQFITPERMKLLGSF